MTAVMTIVRLRWALTLAAVRKSSGQLVGCLIGLISAVGAVCGVAYAGWLLGQGPDAVPQGLLALIGPEVAGLSAAVAYAEVFRVAVILSGAFLTLVVLIMQVVYLGQGSALSPHKFTLYGIPDRQLSLGLLIAGLTGVPSLTGVLCVALWALAYRWMGVVPVLVGVASSPLAIVVIMSLSKLAIAASTSLVCSNRGRNAFYAVAVISAHWAWPPTYLAGLRYRPPSACPLTPPRANGSLSLAIARYARRRWHCVSWARHGACAMIASPRARPAAAGGRWGWACSVGCRIRLPVPSPRDSPHICGVIPVRACCLRCRLFLWR